MRPDLPWNVAGIPPEAREAARAAARREGLSVGEWLTRRILRSFADAGDEDELTRDSLSANKMYRPQDEAPASRRDTDEMLDRVSRSESESSDVWRRIEEQLKGVGRRMESQERSQTENNRAMNKAATEMNIAAREQAQAFDQLGAHVVGLAGRLDRVERDNNSNGLKEAVRGLHTGLSRLADQITQNASQSAAQLSSLAGNLESVAGKLTEARQDAESTAQSLEQRLMALDDRLYTVEKNARNDVDALERALQAAQARGREDSEADRNTTSAAIAKLEENVSRLEARGIDPEVEQRLGGIERSLSNLIEKLEGNEPATAKAIEDTLKKLVSRVEATENRQRDTVSEFRAAINDATTRVAALETRPASASPFAPAANFAPAPEFAAPPPTFDPPPFPDVPTPGAPPPFQAGADPFAPAPAPFDGLPPYAEENPFEPASSFAGDAFEASPSPADSYLSAARRSARAAASAAEAETVSRGFAWNAAKTESTEAGGNRTRSVLIGFGVLVAIALIAGIVLSQNFFGKTQHSSGLGALFAPKQQAAPAPAQAGTPLHALSPSADDNTTAPKPNPQHAAVAPLQTQTVAPAPVHTVPAATRPASTPPAQTQAAVPALDHLTALANGGNAKAELIVGLKYINGDGVAVNEAQGAKWLERSAESGEAVAQYRLGTLYEHGKGVAVDPAKATHWYQAAAMQGNRKAMHNLAVAFAEGTGVKKDYAEAARWFSKAASMGLADSQFNLAVLYERGEGVPQSLLDAYKWYAIAAASGDTESKSRIEALATQISADDRAAAQHAADTFKAVPGDPRANVAPQQSDL